MRSGMAATFVAVVLVGACTSGPSATTGPLVSSTTAGATTYPPATTTVPPATLPPPSSLPETPLVSEGWSLQPGDFLVSSIHGVRVVREGAVVSRPVSSPVEIAFADESGAIVFVTPHPDLFPDRWPDRQSGGGGTMWRLQPDGTLVVMLDSGGDSLEGPEGTLTLYAVEVMRGAATEDPGFGVTPMLVVDPVAGSDELWITPLGHVFPWPRPAPPNEENITGVGWQEPPGPGRFIVAIENDAEAWLEGWDAGFGFLDPFFLVNPVPRGTPCRDDPRLSNCLGTVTTLPGTPLIAYTESDSRHTVTELVIYDTENRKERRRLLVAEEPIYVRQIHASDTQIVVNLVRLFGDRSVHLPAMVIDLANDAIERVPIPGVTTIVRPPLG
ncbi:MAG: hypothetical protein WD184_03785 [Acidimicrobiia bacterium]